MNKKQEDKKYMVEKEKVSAIQLSTIKIDANYFEWKFDIMYLSLFFICFIVS